MGPSNGLRQSFLLLYLGLGLGRCVLENECVRPFSDLALVERSRVGEAAVRKGGIGYDALDNGFRTCEDPDKLQKICDRLGPGAVKNFFWRWLDRLPSPFTPADMRAGYVYDLAFRQFEVSDTRVFERPQAGRMWFEA